MDSGIYQIINTINGHKYIGSAVNLNCRKNDHWNKARRGKHHSIHFQSAWDKYGESAFEFIILIICDREFLSYFEQRFLDLCKHEYNTSKNVIAPMLGINHTDGAKAKIGFTSHNLSEENRQKKREAMLGNTHALGYKHTEEEKIKMSVAHKGKPISTEHKAKIAKANTGKTRTEEEKIKMGVANIGNTYWVGRKHTEKSKLKMRASRLAFIQKQKNIAEVADARHN